MSDIAVSIAMNDRIVLGSDTLESVVLGALFLGSTVYKRVYAEESQGILASSKCRRP